MALRASIVVRSRDEADRLRLTLASLATQPEKPEILVVNDGSSDHTKEVLAEAAREMNIVAIHQSEPLGRSAAANAGAARATGDILVFLDGDTLAGPDFVTRHMEHHRCFSNAIVRGETWHLRGTRAFIDPEAGVPRHGEELRVMRMSQGERERSLVTRKDIHQAFDKIAGRAQPGTYPGFGPRRLLELEVEALNAHPDCPVLWAAAAGSNQSVSRAAFLECGGFHPGISINEHRELALRLCQSGLCMAATTARTYHMIHRSGWRDPLQDTAWEQLFYEAHPIPVVALLPFFWASLSETAPFPAEACIRSLPELAAVAERYRDVHGLKNVREAHLKASVSETGTK